jgi:hypothetical protein
MLKGDFMLSFLHVDPQVCIVPPGRKRPSPKIRAEWRLCNGSAWRRECLTMDASEIERVPANAADQGSYFYAGPATPSSCCRPLDLSIVPDMSASARLS